MNESSIRDERDSTGKKTFLNADSIRTLKRQLDEIVDEERCITHEAHSDRVSFSASVARLSLMLDTVARKGRLTGPEYQQMANDAFWITNDRKSADQFGDPLCGHGHKDGLCEEFVDKAMHCFNEVAAGARQSRTRDT